MAEDPYGREQVKRNPYRFKGAAAPIVRTGNTLVKFKRDVPTADAIKLLREGNSPVPSMSDFKSSSFNLRAEFADADAFMLEQLGVALLPKSKDAQSMRAQHLIKEPQVAGVFHEFYVFSYSLIGDLSDDDDDETIHEDTEIATWGISAVAATQCPHSGRGIKIAILDSGFDGGHPDFVGRNIHYWSAYGDSAARDILGHGTHCAGTAAGPTATTAGRMRYGIAHEAELRIYKVLDDSGTGGDFDVLAGIEQALADGCDLLSMSFGRGAEEGTAPHPAYEDAAQIGLERGCLFVAAAGNSSSRDVGYIAPIDYPANSPSVMAVGAVDSRLRIANFSCGAPVGTSGVDIAAPGAGVFSSVPMPRKYRRLRGTSMAVPHVVGVAALWAQQDQGLRGRALWAALTSNAQGLNIDKAHVGAGLVQAPLTEP
jgi:subtilisin